MAIKNPKKEKLKKLRKELREVKRKNRTIEKKIDKLYSQKIDPWDIEQKIVDLSHRFKQDDWVVTKDKKIVQVMALIGDSMYKVFVPALYLKGRTGMTRTIHEKSILCHVAGLGLENCRIAYSETKWSNRPSEGGVYG